MAVAASPSNAGKPSGFFADLGAKIRSLSPSARRSPSSPTASFVSDAHSITSTKIDERSVSRGREAFQSSGRGGLGNIRQASLSRDRPVDGPDDFSITRGREPAVVSPSSPQPFYSTGRGGAGNIRSPSRDPNATSINDAHEVDVIRKHNDAEVVHSSGRGGLGNISRSRSRDPHDSTNTRSAISPPRHSTGRGGAGNLFAGDAHHQADIAEEDEVDRRAHAVDGGVHSTGRGGYANLTSAHSPPVEHHAHEKGAFQSSGRGGAGNIHDHSA